MGRGWRAGEGAEGVYQESQAWVTSFCSHFTREPQISASGVVLGPLPPHFSHSFLELPLLEHLAKFLIHAGPVLPHLGESLPCGLHPAQLIFEGPPGISGSATRAWAAGELWFDRGLETFPSVSQSVKWVQPLFPQIGGNEANHESG